MAEVFVLEPADGLLLDYLEKRTPGSPLSKADLKRISEWPDMDLDREQLAALRRGERVVVLPPYEGEHFLNRDTSRGDKAVMFWLGSLFGIPLYQFLAALLG